MTHGFPRSQPSTFGVIRCHIVWYDFKGSGSRSKKEHREPKEGVLVRTMTVWVWGRKPRREERRSDGPARRMGAFRPSPGRLAPIRELGYRPFPLVDFSCNTHAANTQGGTYVNIHRLSWVTVCALVLGGCATPPVKSPAPDSVLVQLSSAAQDVRSSLHRLADAEQFAKRHRLPGERLTAPAIPGMDRQVTMPWQGRLEEAVARLTHLSGYHLDVSGKAPAMPILVNLGPRPAPISGMLRNLGLQAGNRADVVVDPSTRTVSLVYLDTGL